MCLQLVLNVQNGWYVPSATRQSNSFFRTFNFVGENRFGFVNIGDPLGRCNAELIFLISRMLVDSLAIPCNVLAMYATRPESLNLIGSTDTSATVSIKDSIFNALSMTDKRQIFWPWSFVFRNWKCTWVLEFFCLLIECGEISHNYSSIEILSGNVNLTSIVLRRGRLRISIFFVSSEICFSKKENCSTLE